MGVIEAQHFHPASPVIALTAGWVGTIALVSGVFVLLRDRYRQAAQAQSSPALARSETSQNFFSGSVRDHNQVLAGVKG